MYCICKRNEKSWQKTPKNQEKYAVDVIYLSITLLGSMINVIVYGVGIDWANQTDFAERLKVEDFVT